MRAIRGRRINAASLRDETCNYCDSIRVGAWPTRQIVSKLRFGMEVYLSWQKNEGGPESALVGRNNPPARRAASGQTGLGARSQSRLSGSAWPESCQTKRWSPSEPGCQDLDDSRGQTFLRGTGD